MVELKVIDLGVEFPDQDLVLVVDDEPALQSVVFDALQDEYRVITAKNGREGFETARKAKPSLIIMDVMMPDMGGYEAVRLLKDTEETKDIPVIMLSAMDFDPSTVQMLEAEPNVKGFLTKPFRPKQLREIVKSNIRKK